MAKSAETQLPLKAFGWAASDASGILSPFHFSRRENGVDDVTLQILYCGVCHSDLHTLKNDWGFTTYPVVPGHEIVGVVTKIGNNVKNFKVGDKVGVGVLVESCKECECCQQDLENHCPRPVFTYNSPYYDGTRTQGGYSNFVVVHQRFVLQFPENLPLDAGAPLLCAGITVYSPMKYYGMTEPGKHLGVAGLGGLGHVAIKFAKAFGLKVTVISTSPNKESEAISRLGADAFLVSSDPAKMKAAIGTMDYIIDTISAVHSLIPLLSLLKLNGKLVTVGLPSKPLELPIFPLVAATKLRFNMEAIQLWVSKHKLATVGGLWASGIGASLVAYSRTRSPMKPSLRLIHARLHAQALTLAVLSGAAAYRYYENHVGEPKPQAQRPVPTMAQLVEWELLSPF